MTKTILILDGPDDEGAPGAQGYATRQGTSFAAPVVSGGLAVVMHYFRGQLGNTEVLARVLGTADVSPDRVPEGAQCPAHLDTDGDRSACELSSTHGRGLMNLDRATRPVGSASTGLPGGLAALDRTALRAPAAWGDLAGRLGDAELASFDEWNAPFFTPLRRHVLPSGGGRALPSFASEHAGTGLPAWQGLGWTSVGDPGPERLRLAYSVDAEGELGAGGLAYTRQALGGALHTGLVFEQDAGLGARGTGGFAGAPSHGLVFGGWSRTFAPEWAGRRGLSLGVQTLWAGGRLTSGSGMLREAGGLYSQHRASLTHAPDGTHGALARVSLSQPLRAESGRALIHRPVGRTRAGAWLYEDLRVPLSPGARALTLELAHERPVGSRARLALGLEHTFDAGHVAGEKDTWVGGKLRVEL